MASPARISQVKRTAGAAHGCTVFVRTCGCGPALAIESPPVSDLNDLLQTPLNALHLELGARMVPFAGYAMPVQYPAGLMA